MVKRNQWKATLLSRVAYAPMALKNYGFGGFTSVSGPCFCVCSLLGDLPNTVLFTHLGGSVADIADALGGKQSRGTAPKIGLAASCTITCLLVFIVALVARREIKQQENRASGDSGLEHPLNDQAGM